MLKTYAQIRFDSKITYFLNKLYRSTQIWPKPIYTQLKPRKMY